MAVLYVGFLLRKHPRVPRQTRRECVVHADTYRRWSVISRSRIFRFKVACRVDLKESLLSVKMPS